MTRKLEGFERSATGHEDALLADLDARGRWLDVEIIAPVQRRDLTRLVQTGRSPVSRSPTVHRASYFPGGPYPCPTVPRIHPAHT